MYRGISNGSIKTKEQFIKEQKQALDNLTSLQESVMAGNTVAQMAAEMKFDRSQFDRQYSAFKGDLTKEDKNLSKFEKKRMQGII